MNNNTNAKEGMRVQSLMAIDKFIEVVTVTKPLDYWRSNVGNETDSRLFDVALDLYKANSEERDLLMELIDERSAHVLAIFSERMVTLAVLQQTQVCLIMGLFTLSLTFTARNEAESFRLFALFYDAARKIEIDVEALFHKVALKSPFKSRTLIYDFLNLDSDEKTLLAFKFRECTSQSNGLLYQRVD